VGEKNSGKSNVIEALRLAATPRNLRRTHYFEADDLAHGRAGRVIETRSRSGMKIAKQAVPEPPQPDK
jgi:putative ATP-dependent endonuclease of the OLD family